jgi:uncharacterized protein YhbP (UPF0306 family)
MNPSEIEKAIREYLPQTVHLSLATSKDNAPWVCEVHFAYDDDLNLYFRSLRSRRHSQEIAANPRVAGDIVVQYPLGQPVIGVYFEGTAKLLGPGGEQQQAFKCVKERLKADDSILEEAKRENGHQFYKITVENYYVFGSFKARPAQKYELKWE